MNIPQGINYKKVQVGKDQEKAQSERDSHSKNRGNNLFPKSLFVQVFGLVAFITCPVVSCRIFVCIPFYFQILSIIVFFFTFINILYYIGAMQAIVRVIGRFLAFCMGTTPAESINAAANIFVSMVDNIFIYSVFFIKAPPIFHTACFVAFSRPKSR